MANSEPVSSHNVARYLGSEFFSYPIWQEGTIQLDRSGQEIQCKLAYNVLNQSVLCQLDNDATVTEVKPFTFTLNGIKFGQQLAKKTSIGSQPYTTILHDGSIRLLKSVTHKLVTKYIANSYEKNQPFIGYYKVDERFYIQKGDAYPEQTNLSRQSLLTILYEQTSQLAPQLSKKQLTVDEVSKLLARYDSLTVLANGNKPLLSQDVLFSTFLHHHIKYPNQAWNNRVYSRVYAGFEVSETGELINISPLSPANTSFGFDQSVQQALRKLTQVKPAYKGKYVLPVSFTYTNRLETSGTHVPINTLASKAFEGRTLLDELVVPVTVTKPVDMVREVWGNN
ncbi:hypothetical protein [Spirosoma pomorum]